MIYFVIWKCPALSALLSVSADPYHVKLHTDGNDNKTDASLLEEVLLITHSVTSLFLRHEEIKTQFPEFRVISVEQIWPFCLSFPGWFKMLFLGTMCQIVFPSL